MGRLIKNKHGFEMSFALMFSIIVGAVILFLAIYATSGFIKTSKYGQTTEAASSISALIDALETGGASSKGIKIDFKQESRTYYNCFSPNAVDVFGKQTIAFSQESGFGQKWAPPGGETTIRNKFIFADSIVQGEEFYLFSKPFNLGFKVGDITVISAKDYCFVAPPNDIEVEIDKFEFNNINITNRLTDCQEDSESVCFNSPGSNCKVNVFSEDGFETGYVEKLSVRMYYTGSLIYGAIFSNPAIYECNVLRLGAKASELAEVYNDKIEIVNIKNCNSVIGPYLNIISATGASISSSQGMTGIYEIAQQMEDQEQRAVCKIYS